MAVENATGVCERIRTELAKVMVGQEKMIRGLLIGLFTGGHVLLEGVPGLAKTTAIRSLSQVLELRFSRIQLTPDLLPADIIGTQVFDPRRAAFTTRKGPVFANIVLADEINRAPAKVQSALLEAMQERQVTIGDQTFPLPSPYLVMATQNPLEHEGTYPLPEAQIDRFMFKLRVDYPSRQEELLVLARAQEQQPPKLEKVANTKDVLDVGRAVAMLHLESVLMEYMVDVVRATRNPEAFGMADLAPLIDFGASPRATLALAAASRAHALLDGRAWVGPDDVKAVGPAVLRHRLILSYEAEAAEFTAERLVRRILDHVPIP